MTWLILDSTTTHSEGLHTTNRTAAQTITLRQNMVKAKTYELFQAPKFMMCNKLGKTAILEYLRQ